MGAGLSVEECTSAENPHVRDCCHLEGETPVEIRIAYQRNVPPAQSLEPPAGAIRAHTATGGRDLAAELLPRRRDGPPGPAARDAERPPMPRGADRLRLPPPASGAWATPRQGGPEAGGGDFDAGTFAVPPDCDSERSGATTPGRMAPAVALHMLHLPQDDGLFPEVIRAAGCPSHTFREASATHRGGCPDARAEPCDDGAPRIQRNSRSGACAAEQKTIEHL